MTDRRLVVHCKREAFDIYVGRPAKPTPYHYGNPFSNRGGTKAAEVVDDPVTEFRHWLHGIAHQELEPERRRWIIRHLPHLAGKVLGCWCITPENPHAECHGTVLAELAYWVEGCTPDEAWQAFNQPEPPLPAWADKIDPLPVNPRTGLPSLMADLENWVDQRQAEAAPARATDSTPTPVAQEVRGCGRFERNGQRVHLACILGEDLDEARRLQVRLYELKRAAGL